MSRALGQGCVKPLGLLGGTTATHVCVWCCVHGEEDTAFCLPEQHVPVGAVPPPLPFLPLAASCCQVGCPMRCTFCATGKGGFARNLAAHEIVDQVMTVGEVFGQRPTNVVFMGM